MKRSAINRVYREASAFLHSCHWHLPPNPRWDVTDFGLGRFDEEGLVLVNLAEEPEYCEKIMYVRPGQRVPEHWHAKKKEDIICRAGELVMHLWHRSGSYRYKVNGNGFEASGEKNLTLTPGERVTLFPTVVHAFWAGGADPCLVSEVSTANDDLTDNYFENPDIGRFPEIEEDEAAEVRLVGEAQG